MSDITQRYLAESTRHIIVTEAEQLKAMYAADYQSIEVEMHSPQACVELGALAKQVNLVLSADSTYTFQSNFQTGSIDIFNAAGDRVVGLDVDASGSSLATLQIGGGQEVRPQLDPATGNIIQSSLPGQGAGSDDGSGSGSQEGAIVNEQEPNDQLSAATPAALGDTLQGTSKENGDSDVYRLDLNTGGEIELDFTHPNGPGSEGAEMVLALLDEGGQVVTSRELRGDDTLHASVAGPGTYHVRVEDATGYKTDGVNGAFEDGHYRLSTRLQRDADTAYDTAGNGALSSAVATLADGDTAIVLGHDLVGSVAGQGDTDVYRFTTETGGDVTLDFTHPNGPGSEGAEMVLALLDEGGQVVTSRELRGDDTLHASVAGPGTYHVRVEDATGYMTDGVNGAFEDGHYRVSTRLQRDADTAYDTAGNNALSSAVDTLADGVTPLTFDHAIHGTFAGDGDRDVFRISAAEESMITLAFTHPNGPGSEGAEVDIALYNQHGEVMAEASMTGNSHFELAPTPGEVHYLSVSDSTGYQTDGINASVEDAPYLIDFLIG